MGYGGGGFCCATPCCKRVALGPSLGFEIKNILENFMSWLIHMSETQSGFLEVFQLRIVRERNIVIGNIDEYGHYRHHR